MSWKRTFIRQRSKYIFESLVLIGAITFIFRGYATAMPAAFAAAILMATLILVQPIKFLLQYFQMRKYCAALSSEETVVQVGFNDQILWQRGSEVYTEWKWKFIVRYELLDDILMIYFQDTHWPMMISTSEVPQEFFWELIAQLDRNDLKKENSDSSTAEQNSQD